MAIEIEHLRKDYANVSPLKDVNAVIDKGEIISIIGPSGTGKSPTTTSSGGLGRPVRAIACLP